MKASSRANLSPQNITIVDKTEKKRKRIYAEGNKEGGSHYHLWLLQATCSRDGGGSLRSHPSYLFRGHTIRTPQCHENYHNMLPLQYWWSWLKCTQHQPWAPEELSILFHMIPTLNTWFPWPSLPLSVFQHEHWVIRQKNSCLYLFISSLVVWLFSSVVCLCHSLLRFFLSSVGFRFVATLRFTCVDLWLYVLVLSW